jgi:hypothetical protein
VRRLVGKRMKAWNKRVYYAVKYLLIGGILAAFLATAFELCRTLRPLDTAPQQIVRDSRPAVPPFSSPWLDRGRPIHMR